MLSPGHRGRCALLEPVRSFDDDFPAFLIGWNLKMLNGDNDFPKFLTLWGVMFAGIVLLLFVLTHAGTESINVG